MYCTSRSSSDWTRSNTHTLFGFSQLFQIRSKENLIISNMRNRIFTREHYNLYLFQVSIEWSWGAKCKKFSFLFFLVILRTTTDKTRKIIRGTVLILKFWTFKNKTKQRKKFSNFKTIFIDRKLLNTWNFETVWLCQDLTLEIYII